MLKPRHLLFIDQLLLIPYKVLLYIFWNIRKHSVIQARQDGRAVVLKFMGMGSIIRIASIWEKSHVNFEKIILCTFRQNKELCELLGFTQVIYIRTDGWIHFLADTYTAILQIRKQKPAYLLDLERCSAAVGIFRICCAGVAVCKTVALDKQPHNKAGHHDSVWSLGELSYGAAIERMATHLSKKQTSGKQTITTPIDAHKILVNINASAYLPQRKYPPGHFVQLIQALHSHNKQFAFYLTGSPDEYTYVQEVVNILQQQGLTAYNVAGRWNLHQLVQQLSACKLFITNDSGPMHLAVYMQIPTVVLWGPTHYYYFGYENNATTKHLSLQPTCSPCFTDPRSKVGIACQKKILCMQELSPQWIVSQIKDWLLSCTSPDRPYILPKGMLHLEPKRHMQLTQ